MKNVGNVDRIVRIVIGLGLIAVALTGKSAWGWLGVIPLGTAFMGFCPLYRLFGLRTCPLKH